MLSSLRHAFFPRQVLMNKHAFAQSSEELKEGCSCPDVGVSHQAGVEAEFDDEVHNGPRAEAEHSCEVHHSCAGRQRPPDRPPDALRRPHLGLLLLLRRLRRRRHVYHCLLWLLLQQNPRNNPFSQLRVSIQRPYLTGLEHRKVKAQQGTNKTTDY